MANKSNTANLVAMPGKLSATLTTIMANLVSMI